MLRQYANLDRGTVIVTGGLEVGYLQAYAQAYKVLLILATTYNQSRRNAETRRPYSEKLVIPDGVSHNASQEKSKAFGSNMSDNKKLASSKLGITGTSLPFPLATMLVGSVSDGCGTSRAFKDAIFDTGSAHLSKT